MAQYNPHAQFIQGVPVIQTPTHDQMMVPTTVAGGEVVTQQRSSLAHLPNLAPMTSQMIYAAIPSHPIAAAFAPDPFQQHLAAAIAAANKQESDNFNQNDQAKFSFRQSDGRNLASNQISTTPPPPPTGQTTRLDSPGPFPQSDGRLEALLSAITATSDQGRSNAPSITINSSGKRSRRNGSDDENDDDFTLGSNPVARSGATGDADGETVARKKRKLNDEAAQPIKSDPHQQPPAKLSEEERRLNAIESARRLNAIFPSVVRYRNHTKYGQMKRVLVGQYYSGRGAFSHLLFQIEVDGTLYSDHKSAYMALLEGYNHSPYQFWQFVDLYGEFDGHIGWHKLASVVPERVRQGALVWSSKFHTLVPPTVPEGFKLTRLEDDPVLAEQSHAQEMLAHRHHGGLRTPTPPPLSISEDVSATTDGVEAEPSTNVKSEPSAQQYLAVEKKIHRLGRAAKHQSASSTATATDAAEQDLTFASRFLKSFTVPQPQAIAISPPSGAEKHHVIKVQECSCSAMAMTDLMRQKNAELLEWADRPIRKTAFDGDWFNEMLEHQCCPTHSTPQQCVLFPKRLVKTMSPLAEKLIVARSEVNSTLQCRVKLEDWLVMQHGPAERALEDARKQAAEPSISMAFLAAQLEANLKLLMKCSAATASLSPYSSSLTLEQQVAVVIQKLCNENAPAAALYLRKLWLDEADQRCRCSAICPNCNGTFEEFTQKTFCLLCGIAPTKQTVEESFPPRAARRRLSDMLDTSALKSLLDVI